MKYSHNDMTIESSFSFAAVYKMKLSAKVNEHIKLELWAELKQEDATDVMMQNHADTHIKVTLPDKQNYFTGLLSEIDIQEKNGLFSIYLSCISASFLLDIHPRCSSYQDTSENYADVLKDTYRRETGAYILARKKADIPIQTPLIQYEETTWAFTLRMAGKLSAYVIADCSSVYPRVILGNIDPPEVELDEVEYTVGYHQANGYFYSCQSLKQLNLGDTVILHRYKLFVVEKQSTFANGEFVNVYTLGTESGYSVKPHKLPLSGLRLKGIVLATQGEKVKLHLDIDANQNRDKAFWFDFVPQSGNVMYGMPQVGERAILRFCSDQEVSAVAEECWRENGQGCSDLADYHNRYFTSEYGKRMAMLPESLFFKSDDNQAELSDRTGIQLKTGHRTKILAAQGILITANKKIRCEAPHHIYMTKSGTQSVVDFSNNEINIESLNTNIITKPESKANKSYSPFRPEPTVAISRCLALAALAFIPKKSGRGVQ